MSGFADYTYDATKNTKTTVSKSFVIKDSSNDAITDMKLKDSKVDSAGIKAVLASVIQFSYGGDKYGADGDYAAEITAIEGYSNVIAGNGKITSDNMDTMLASGAVQGYMTQEVSVSRSITDK